MKPTCGHCGRYISFEEQYFCNQQCQMLWYEKHVAGLIPGAQTVWDSPATTINE